MVVTGGLCKFLEDFEARMCVSNDVLVGKYFSYIGVLDLVRQ